MSYEYPTSGDKLTLDALNSLLNTNASDGTSIQSFTVVESKVYGDGMTSTAGRIVVDVDYVASSAADLPRRLVLKVARADDRTGEPLYANEVAIYNRIKPWKVVEAPISLGGVYYPENASFGLLLEDLRERGAVFPNVTKKISLAQMQSLLSNVARLHATFWNSPRLRGDLAWMETHVHGGLHELFTNPTKVPAWIEHLVDTVQFKREMVQRLGLSLEDLYNGVGKLQRHQATLPQTVVHGDTHIGNTYLLPDGRGGLLDWQLSVQGYCMHDISYLITTGLDVEARRQNEQDLLRFYIDQLRLAGLKDVPGFDEIWIEYRRAQAWNVYIGWLTCDVPNYGWEICVLSHLRVMTAFEDLETASLLAAMD